MIFCHAHCPSESQSNGYVDLSRQGGRRSLQCCLRQNASSQNHKHPSPNPLYPLSCKDGSCPLLFQFLVKQFFKEKFDFYFTGAYQATKKDQLFNFKMTLESYWLSGNLVGISINLYKSKQKELFINNTP